MAWRDIVQEDLYLLVEACGDKLGELGPPMLPAMRWQRVWREHPQSWKQLVKQFVLKTVADAPLARKVRAFAFPGAAAAREAGLPAFACYDCGSGFATTGALAAHRRAAHGARRLAWSVVLDSRCPACGGDYVTRLRCMEHLERVAASCRAALEEGRLPELPWDVLEAADALDRHHRAECRAAGVLERSGLPARPAFRRRG